MARNAVFPHTNTEIWPVGVEVAAGVPLISAADEPAVTLTASGAHTKSQALGPYTVSGIPDGGVGLDALQVVVATDGTWEFEVAGASSSTLQNALVYITGGGDLTLTASTNDPFGKVNYPQDYAYKTGILPVAIGVYA